MGMELLCKGKRARNSLWVAEWHQVGSRQRAGTPLGWAQLAGVPVLLGHVDVLIL